MIFIVSVPAAGMNSVLLVPGISDTGVRDELAGNMDIIPTLMDLCGIPMIPDGQVDASKFFD